MAGAKSHYFTDRDDEDRLWDATLKDIENDKHKEKLPLKSNGQLSKNDEKGEGTQPNGQEKFQMVGMFEIFRFAYSLDKLLMFLGVLMAALNGSTYPIMLVMFGETLDFMVDVQRVQNYVDTIPEYLSLYGYDKDDFMADSKMLDDAMCDDIALFYNGTRNCTTILDDKIMDKVAVFCIMFAVLAGISISTGYGLVSFWMMSAERQCHQIRRNCLRSILRQHIGWFDTYQSSEINTRLYDDISKIQDGIGDKLGFLFKTMSGIFLSLGASFYYGWKLTLVLFACCPVLIFCWTMIAKVLANMASKETEAYSKAGAIAQEVFGAIRTVVAFGGQEKEAARYFEHLDEAHRCGISKGFVNGAFMGFNMMLLFSCYGLGFWYGGKLHRDDPDEFDFSDTITVLYCVMYGAYEIGSLAPSIQSLAIARGAAHGIFQLIDQESQIDSSSEKGYRPPAVDGLIQFKNVHFNYPARPDVKVLNNVCLEALPGQTVALVGSSGCGKSTVVQLLLRFYDTMQGQVLLDGRDVKELNIKWLRGSIGLVSQEPVLFADTIEQNIRYGRENVTFDQIVAASKKANAYDFISKLPDKFNTLVGERGAQLSGGQKQRIAIARALVRDPKILLLDEATSALDMESEAIVQDALDKARRGRTTLVIAHRLSTIKTADIIVGIEKGEVKEMGTHSELMAHQGIYHQLVVSQKTTLKEEGDEVSNLKNSDKENLTRAVADQILLQDNDEIKEDEEVLPDAPFSRLLLMNAPEWYYIVLGCFGSMANGAVYPMLVVLLSHILDTFAGDEDDKKDDFLKLTIIFILFGVGNLLACFLQSYMFSCAGETLTLRLRNLTFRAMLKKDISWFDDPRNGVGALTTRLSSDAAQVQGLTAYKIGGLLMSISSLTIGMSFAFYYSWKQTMTILVFFPIMAVSTFLQVRLTSAQALENKRGQEEAGKITVESIENIRTVASLCLEQTCLDRYVACISVPYRANLKQAHFLGFNYGFSGAIFFIAYASSFAVGGRLVEQGDMDFGDVFLVFGCVVFGAFGIGSATALFPDMANAQISAKRILHIIDSKPEVDHTDPSGKKLQSDYHPKLTFKDVQFHYASRAGVPVFQGLNVTVSPGQTLALVGSSGCGKSTSIQLIERFYDCHNGSLCLDNNNIKSLNVQWYRRQFGLVSQEPVLFNGSIRDNVAYGDNSRIVSMSEIIEATRKANVHHFISSLPEGYETNVGANGTQLSGGQKQRIAIARALVRNPKILLLDEATSALDMESEKIVQEALDKARKDRTCIVIAHRLSTIQNADRICVISQGKVSEEGTHNELIEKEGFYYELLRSSQR